MDFGQFELLIVLGIGLSSFVLLMSPNWRWQVGALGMQYFGEFALIAISWPLDLAAVKLVAGWMGAAILGISRINQPKEATEDVEVGRVFRLATGVMVVITVGSIAPDAMEWIPTLGLYQAWGGFLLIGMGVLLIGFYAYGLRLVYGLMTIIAGFEILYSVVEVSTLVTSLLAMVTVGISIIGAYLSSNTIPGEKN